MCERWKYTLIFWDVQGSGSKFQVKDPVLEQLLEEMVGDNETLQRLKQEDRIDVQKGRAFITGSFTNWNPRKMMQIDELCAYLEHKDEVLHNPDRREFYCNQIKKKWRRIITQGIQYLGDGA